MESAQIVMGHYTDLLRSHPRIDRYGFHMTTPLPNPDPGFHPILISRFLNSNRVGPSSLIRREICVDRPIRFPASPGYGKRIRPLPNDDPRTMAPPFASTMCITIPGSTEAVQTTVGESHDVNARAPAHRRKVDKRCRIIA